MGGQSEKSLSQDGVMAAEIPSSGETSWSSDAERKLVRKIDLFLLPSIWLMSLFSWMDRANLGNANIAGLTADLGLSSSQFSMAVITYYFGYIIWVPISTMILARTRPSLYLPAIMMLWGAVTCGGAGVKTYPQLLALRVLLGILESGLSPGITYMFSCWYRPDEIGKRVSTYNTSALVGGAFGGLIAGGVMENLEGAKGLRGWRWLFLIEGLVTIVVSVAAISTLPDIPATWGRLSPEEKTIAMKRLQNIGIQVNDSGKSKPKLGVGQCVVLALKDWRSYAIALGAGFISAMLIMAYFYPVLVRGLGYTDPVKAQYMTVPIWAVGLVFTMASGFVTDRLPHWRVPVLASCLLLSVIMAVITCAVYNFKARYVFLALMTGGVWAGFTQGIAYIAELFQDVPPEQRAVTMGLMSVVGSTGNVYGAYLFPAGHAPKYLVGFGMVAATGAIAAGSFLLIWILERRKQRYERR
ncbi:putative transporter-like protein 21 [Podospora australis]|uniref:Transporter-like protein 21 n=1 Tax=Podospora australis TaxID=1536484 RepID=A0AAN6WIZ2_9PEZI|nr:putative transporter-like protein 21 [Podospora australis]